MESFDNLNSIFQSKSEIDLFQSYSYFRKDNTVLFDKSTSSYSVFSNSLVNKISAYCNQVASTIDSIKCISYDLGKKHHFLSNLFRLLDNRLMFQQATKSINEVAGNNFRKNGFLTKPAVDRIPLQLIYEIFEFQIIDLDEFSDIWNLLLNERDDKKQSHDYYRTFSTEILYNKLSENSSLISRISRDPFFKECQLSTNELLQTIIFLISTAYLTSVNLLSNIALAFYRFPELNSKIRKGIITPQSFAKEVLRYYSPVQCVKRVANIDFDIGDLQIKKEQALLLWIGSANHDLSANSFHFGNFQSSINSNTFGVDPYQCYASGLAMVISFEFTKIITGNDFKVEIDQVNIKKQLGNFLLGIQDYTITL